MTGVQTCALPISSFQRRARADLSAHLQNELGDLVDRYEALKSKRGRLDFLDLLLKARDALRDHAGVREWYRRRFRYLVIDEFQDTDPLQVEIARLLAGDRAGALVVVGDAKQSIYRFRRVPVKSDEIGRAHV